MRGRRERVRGKKINRDIERMTILEIKCKDEEMSWLTASKIK